MTKPMASDAEKAIESEHYFTQNKHNYHVKINVNGMARALASETLGEQVLWPYFTKTLPSIMQ